MFISLALSSSIIFVGGLSMDDIVISFSSLIILLSTSHFFSSANLPSVKLISVAIVPNSNSINHTISGTSKIKISFLNTTFVNCLLIFPEILSVSYHCTKQIYHTTTNVANFLTIINQEHLLWK
ncbi:hypothetical protein GLOIN_2v1725814 [Rhizophagus irregularis DAOM 181602=DAOM 197198]|uniref:Uncharacterized protein n=1 Tax=Rhizophagus irregularis (strain DAOM 181602 / DAOM 197198 / MUCL 43194) TaxID=747089 RepID=A0A2P4P0U5_RHIID|nr:hypothetical protein GLOIN_2v1725814 [Rhizophagus irregularis DAOM 181602=DAOM 197198]POG59011.1 hypothetical protein GLOIN_2v1725814 [Rhizophagus irregularis DAOM 181602=DAOM 197198]|eukprot:XP_025165877.1 hypothetical protein GLOIN_2v1725814 [Rhizophagus irregularis DAOM 181602=DAOM 197198]